MYLWEEADYIYTEYITAQGEEISGGVYTYGLFAAIGAALMMLVLYFAAEWKKLPKGSAPLMGALGIALGAVCSKVLFALFNLDGLSFFGKLRPDMFSGGGFSMMGAVVGGFVGAGIAGLIMKEKPLKFLDAFAVAVPAFILFARLGEQFDLNGDFGVSSPLNHPFSKNLPAFLLQEGEYGNYLLVYKLEAIAAGIILLALLVHLFLQKKDGNAFILFLLLFGASQGLLESLRADKHMNLSFLHLQQLMAIPMLIGGVMMAASRAGKSKKFKWLLFGGMVLVAGLGAGLEVIIYRPDLLFPLDIYVTYILYAVLVSVPVALGIWLLRKKA